MYESFAIAGPNFRAERDSNKVRMAIIPKLAIEILARSDE